MTHLPAHAQGAENDASSTRRDAGRARRHARWSATLVEDDRELVEDDLLVEDVSIDGMCGVY